ncbi:ParB N-terminal domain-containing protein [Actinomadura sp. KC216]|uniref:ParB N-terminal domain-containing protein n=1 Tax=Actinomadura sp. KC216 TaxID=2530370 RepID=UPI001404292F|nr:ParB N-terminal domain-containing protein [Actinomadura sp. KC216]
MSDHEVFQFLSWRWDITKAQEIAAELPVQRVDPKPWFGWLGAIALNEDHIPTVALDRPIIAVRLRELDGAAMIIDGWHRIARAQRDGVTELPIVVLDEDQEYQVRIFGGDKLPCPP